ncbi:MAG: DNA mismatch repair protein MutS, partial [Clostridiales bacterium]|nr:DNA mismatch repair protein MutS [Clostridiales bacterium]
KAMKNPEKLLNYAKAEGDFLKGKGWRRVATILPWVIIALWAVGYVANIHLLITGALILMFISYGFQFFHAPRIGEVKGMLGTIIYELNEYVYILEVLKEKEFISPYLKELSNVLFKDQVNALDALKKLEKISSKANVTTQPIVAIPLDAILLWDLKIVFALEDWRKTYGQQVEHYLETIGEIESLISLSVLGHVEEKVSFPLVEAEGRFITGKQVGHPLIKQTVRVCNDVNMDQEIFVITGSNMSGKTTFLRTIGINLVLAYAGAPVLADQLACSMMKIYTSMRIRDDLTHGISTFYAELTRIKQIIEAAKEYTQMLFLIDEIFRGTNSNDRIIGATSVVKALDSLGTIGAITTHDMELCQLNDTIDVTNYHFSETYQEDTIQFDYSIKAGPSTTTNAKYLMKMVGIELIQ